MDRVDLQNVDYLSHVWQEEDIIATEKYIRVRKSNFQNYHRLQYALLRNWAKLRNNGLCCIALESAHTPR
ncbi:hypothetical protein PENSUB_2224 [Penicillium subrubescens]|uniref:Uncharacterized protein n=1 Tax=Penicillium subrubescens TaxID=1316194 RepID=A0A1Q5UIB4_9EURO|nr:hypothetical protein PENSUB_2224 [Penicillium subrubescens]